MRTRCKKKPMRTLCKIKQWWHFVKKKKKTTMRTLWKKPQKTMRTLESVVPETVDSSLQF
jgi:hypothetical protein